MLEERVHKARKKKKKKVPIFITTKRNKRTIYTEILNK